MSGVEFQEQREPERRSGCTPCITRRSTASLWDAQFGQWTQKAINQVSTPGSSTRTRSSISSPPRPDLITGANGTGYGSTGFIINCPILGFIINCPILGFLAHKPSADLVDLVPRTQG